MVTDRKYTHIEVKGKYFELPIGAVEIAELIEEHKRLRARASSGVINAIKRMHEINGEIEDIFAERHPGV